MSPSDFTHKVPSPQSFESNLPSYIMSRSKNYLSPSYHSQATQAIIVHNDHPILTRAKTRHSKPKILLTHTEPSSIKQEFSQAHWFEAMGAEYDPCMHNALGTSQHSL